jgi:hypothetical protein
VAEVQPVEGRGADLVKRSGQPSVRDRGVHERQYAVALGRLSNPLRGTVPKYARAMAAGVAESIDLTDLTGRLRNSVYRGIWESPV